MLIDGSAIRTVFLDAVGTLIHPVPAVAATYLRLARPSGVTLSEEQIAQRFRAAFQDQEEEDRRQGFQTSEERERRRWRAIVAAVFCDQANPQGPFEALWQHYARPDAWACFPDAARCLEWLKARGLEVGIASNYDGRLRSVVAGLPALRSSSHLAISAEIGWRKPAARFFAALADLAQLPAHQVLHVGDDWENDCVAAREAGMQAVWLNRNEKQPTSSGIASLNELPGILGAR